MNENVVPSPGARDARITQPCSRRMLRTIDEPDPGPLSPAATSPGPVEAVEDLLEVLLRRSRPRCPSPGRRRTRACRAPSVDLDRARVAVELDRVRQQVQEAPGGSCRGRRGPTSVRLVEPARDTRCPSRSILSRSRSSASSTTGASGKRRTDHRRRSRSCAREREEVVDHRDQPVDVRRARGPAPSSARR